MSPNMFDRFLELVTLECGPKIERTQYNWIKIASQLPSDPMLFQIPPLVVDGEALRIIYRRTLEWLQKAKYISKFSKFSGQ
jgi:hypothetical protein